MAEQHTHTEMKEHTHAKASETHTHKTEEKHTEHTHTEHTATETKATTEKKPAQKKVVKKDIAVAHGDGLGISLKQGMAICDFIKGKPIDQAISELEQVILMKRAIPFKGEIPHRKGDMMSGRYPITASKEFISVLKGLRGNSLVNGLELDNTVISYASASWAFRPARRGGRYAKRVNLILRSSERKTKEKK